MSTNAPRDPDATVPPPSRTTADPTRNDHTLKESMIGTDRGARFSNVSWGAIFAGVVTFLALTVLFAAVTAGLGLAEEGTAAGIWSIVAVLLALGIAGFVAGALAVRGGFVHGFLTWATSMVAAVLLTALATANLLGAVGNVVNQAAEVTDVGQAVEVIQDTIDQEDIDQADQVLSEIEQQAGDAADTAQTSVWWAFAGMMAGAVVAAGAGMLGSRAVVTRDEVARTR